MKRSSINFDGRGERGRIGGRDEEARLFVAHRLGHPSDSRRHGRPFHQKGLDRAAEALGEGALHGDVERDEHALQVVAMPWEEHSLDEAVRAAAFDQGLAIRLAELVRPASDQDEARFRKAAGDDARCREKCVVSFQPHAARRARRLRSAHGRIEVRDESDQRRVR